MKKNYKQKNLLNVMYVCVVLFGIIALALGALYAIASPNPSPSIKPMPTISVRQRCDWRLPNPDCPAAYSCVMETVGFMAGQAFCEPPKLN